jgi:cytochrome c oxidase cbb3-type subunit 3
MHIHKILIASALAAFTVVTAHVGAQAPQTPTPAGGAPQTPAPPGGAAGRGGGRQGEPAVFPAQQRPPGDPALIERGKGLFTINCSACHGTDLRGGGMGGPNLLRSQLVLSDEHGELITPIVRGARADKGMPPLPLSDDDVKAVAEFIHSVVATGRKQGAPPPSDAPPPDAIVGNAKAGETYFAAKCSQCHSPTGDLQGIGSRMPEGKELQNFWVTGGNGGRRGGRGGGRGSGPGGASADPGAPDSRAVIATVTLPSGEKVQGPLVRIDNFLVTLRQADGTMRTLRRDGDLPRVELKDPLDAHKAMPGELTDKDMHDVTAFLATLK